MLGLHPVGSLIATLEIINNADLPFITQSIGQDAGVQATVLTFVVGQGFPLMLGLVVMNLRTIKPQTYLAMVTPNFVLELKRTLSPDIMYHNA